MMEDYNVHQSFQVCVSPVTGLLMEVRKLDYILLPLLISMNSNNRTWHLEVPATFDSMAMLQLTPAFAEPIAYC